MESGEADIRMSQNWVSSEWSVEDNKFLFTITKHFLEFSHDHVQIPVTAASLIFPRAAPHLTQPPHWCEGPTGWPS